VQRDGSVGVFLLREVSGVFSFLGGLVVK